MKIAFFSESTVKLYVIPFIVTIKFSLLTTQSWLLQAQNNLTLNMTQVLKCS